MADLKKTERILNLVSFLFKMEGRRPVPWREIRDTVSGYDDGADAESLRRRFERDKRFLESLGIEIEYVSDSPGGDGYRIRGEATLMPPVSLEPAELALLTALGASAGRADTPFARHLRSAILKTRFDDPDEAPEGAGLGERILPAGGATSDARLATLGEAVALGRTVSFDYAGLSGPAARRTLDPYGLFAKGGAWYVVGLSRERRAVRTFKVDRIEGPVELAAAGDGPDFEVPADFRLEEHARREAWSFESRRPVRVRIAFDADRFGLVARRPDAIDPREASDGSGEVSFDATDEDAFVRWVLGFGPHARILDPPRLVKRLVERVRALLAASAP